MSEGAEMEWEADRKTLVFAMADTHRATIQLYDGMGKLRWPAGATYTTWGTEEEVLDGLAEEMLRVSHESRTVR